jgi:threonine/homoserine/homoserine lactone efflux protein
MVTTFAALFGVLTLGLLSPGPDFLLILRNSLGPSRARAFGTAAGIVTGLVAQTLAISLGFAALPPATMRVVQLVGAAYLAYLGLRSLLATAEPSAPTATVPPVTTTDPAQHVLLSRSGQKSVHSAHGPSPALRSGFTDGLVCNLTNPKAFLFFVGLFAQVLPPGTSLGWRIALPVMIVVHGATMWTLIVLALRAPVVAGQLRRAQHWLPRAFGVALLILAAWIIYGAIGER